MTDYAETVATLIDDGLTNSALAETLLRQRREDVLPIPDAVLFVIERFDILMAQAPDDAARRQYRALFDAEDIDWFDEPPTRRVMRRFLQSQRHGLAPDEIEAFIASEGGEGGVLRLLKGLIGDADKRKTLRALHVIDGQGCWSEFGFQRLADVMDDLSANMEKRPAGLETLRWELHRRHYFDRPMRLADTLMNDRLPHPVLLRAHRIARIGLETTGALKLPLTATTLSPQQIDHLRALGAWIHGADFMARSPALEWVRLMASEPGVNWRRYREIVTFVTPKIDRPPQPDLIRDWLDGLVTFEGEGAIRSRIREDAD